MGAVPWDSQQEEIKAVDVSQLVWFSFKGAQVFHLKESFSYNSFNCRVDSIDSVYAFRVPPTHLVFLWEQFQQLFQRFNVKLGAVSSLDHCHKLLMGTVVQQQNTKQNDVNQ